MEVQVSPQEREKLVRAGVEALTAFAELLKAATALLKKAAEAQGKGQRPF